MEEPVRVGLIFPRSGQQLFVRVPRQLALAAEAHVANRYGVFSEQLFRSSDPQTQDESRRRQ